MKNIGKYIIAFIIFIGAMILREVTAAIGLTVINIQKMSADKTLVDRTNLEMADQLLQDLLNHSEITLLLSVICSLVWIILFGFIYISIRKKQEKSISLMKGLRIQNVAILFLFGLGLQLFIGNLLTVLQFIIPNQMEVYQQVIQNLGMGSSFISFIYVAFVAPIGEELLFRGSVFHYLRKYSSFWSVNIFQALLFGVFHLNIIQGCYAFVLGLLFGWLAEKYDSIRESILLHIAVNLSGCLISMLIPDAIVNNPLFIGIGILSAICILAFSAGFLKKDTQSDLSLSL